MLFEVLTRRGNVPKHHPMQNTDIQISAEKQVQGYTHVCKWHVITCTLIPFQPQWKATAKLCA